jgi:sulfur carrier protein ThiS
MRAQIRVELRLIATLRPYMPAGEDESSCELVVAEGTRAADLLRELGVPEEMLVASALLINGRPGSADHVLQNGDRLAAFPAMAGG